MKSSATIAEIAYSVYSREVDGKNVRGTALPLFADIGEPTQTGWKKVVEAVRSPRLSDLEDAPLAEAFEKLHKALGSPEIQVSDEQNPNVALILMAAKTVAGIYGRDEAAAA